MAEMICKFFINSGKIDILLIDTYGTLNFWYALIISQLANWFKIPYVPILHGGSLPQRIKANPRLCKMIFSKSLKNIAPSGYLKEAFSGAGFPTITIPNFINLKKYGFKKRIVVDARILWVRSIEDVYNPAMAIKTLAFLNKKFHNVSLCMIGPVKDKSIDECHSIVKKLDLSDKIEFKGRLEKSEWIALSKDFDIFLNTANYDNTPVSLIEAMALGLPVVSTNVGGIPYLIDDGETGLLVERDNAEEMSAAICRLIENPALAAKISTNARIKAEEFDVGKVMEQWKNLLGD